MATEPTIMKMRLAEINRFVQTLQKNPDHYTDEAWYRGYEHAEVTISKKLRDIMGNLPKGYVRSQPSLKTLAKTRFLQWRENQAKAEWKKLTPEERAVWEGYVTEGIEFGEVRARELEREAPLKVGDRVEIVKDIYFLGSRYRPGLVGEVKSLNCYDGTDVVSSYSLTFKGAGLPPVNAYAHEVRAYAHQIKKEGK